MKTYPQFNHSLFTAAGGSLIGNNSSKRLPLNFRKFQSQRGRDAILMSMRHWLAGVLAKEQAALFRDLPESFKVGQSLPQKKTGSAAVLPYHKPKTVGLTCRSAPILGTRSNASLLKRKTIHGKPEVFHPVSRFVHGCKLLAIWQTRFLHEPLRRPAADSLLSRDKATIR